MPTRDTRLRQLAEIFGGQHNLDEYVESWREPSHRYKGGKQTARYGQDFVVRRDMKDLISKRQNLNLHVPSHMVRSPISVILLSLRVGQSAVFTLPDTRPSFSKEIPQLYNYVSEKIKYLKTSDVGYMRRLNGNELRVTRIQ